MQEITKCWWMIIDEQKAQKISAEYLAVEKLPLSYSCPSSPCKHDYRPYHLRERPNRKCPITT